VAQQAGLVAANYEAGLAKRDMPKLLPRATLRLLVRLLARWGLAYACDDESMQGHSADRIEQLERLTQLNKS